MARFEVEETDSESGVRRARETASERVVVLERGIRAERVRQIHRVPPNPAIAPYLRVRLDKRVQLVHPAPLEFATPPDEFDVAHAIGSLLDGLAWLHEHRFTHGAVDELALTSGPTGGRLSLAGALSRRGTATAADDVFGAAALAYGFLVGEPPGLGAHDDPRLEFCSSRAIAEAVRAGLHPDPDARPTAAALATMVRGELLLPVVEHRAFQNPIARMREFVASLGTHVERLVASMRPYGSRTAAGFAGGIALIVVVAALATAEQRRSVFADADFDVAEAIAADVTAAADSNARAPVAKLVIGSQLPFEDLIAMNAPALAPPSVAVLSSATVVASIPAPTTTTAPPSVTAPPTTIVVASPPTTATPPPPAPVTTTAPTTTSAPTTTAAPTTTRVTTTTRTTTTTPATTTTRKGKRERDD